MLKSHAMARKVSSRVSNAADGAFDAYVEGRIWEEPKITDRILGAVEESIKTLRFNGVAWKARTLQTGRGRAAEEKRHGADLMGVLDIDLPDHRKKKSFLSQSKRAKPSVPLKAVDWEHLIDQCKKIIDHARNSFAFIYSRRKRIRIFPANEVFALKSKDTFTLYDHGMQHFYEEHLKYFIGDDCLNSTNIRTLDVLAGFSVDNVPQITARPPE